MEKILQRMKKQGYHFVGLHSAIKKCHWLHNSLIHGKPCYKQIFYGISSHKCLQMSPSIFHCLTSCIYCWRIEPMDFGFNHILLPKYWDDPDYIIDGSIREQRRILSGYKAQVLEGKISGKKL